MVSIFRSCYTVLMLDRVKKYLNKTRESLHSLPCSSVSVVYKSRNGLYRGFVQPYDVTYEAVEEQNTQNSVLSILRDMREQYEEGLKKYEYPSHLSAVPLSDEEDKEKLNKIFPALMQQLASKNPIVVT